MRNKLNTVGYPHHGQDTRTPQQKREQELAKRWVAGYKHHMTIAKGFEKRIHEYLRKNGLNLPSQVDNPTVAAQGFEGNNPDRGGG